MTERPWARHYQDQWQERAGDPRFPYWLRVAALAYGSHLDNGHARFKRGEIGIVLGAPGEPYSHVRRAIEVAVDYGWLEPGSFWGCLIVPNHAIRKGPWATPKPCPVHAKRPLSGRKRGAPLPLSGRFEDESGHSVAGSERASLFLICPPQPNDDPPPEDPTERTA